MDLEQSAFEALRFASAQSLKLYKQPLVITYSGGKDSDVLLRLAINSGIPFEALHSLTTADAPETVYHVRDTFRRMEEKGVKCVIDAHVQPGGKRVTMWNLIPQKLMPPTRLARSMSANYTGIVWDWLTEGRTAPQRGEKKPGYNVQRHGDKLTDLERQAIARMMEED